MQKEIINFLLNSDPWTEFRTRIDLLNEQADSPEVLSARQRMVAHPLVKSLVQELAEWPGVVLNSHKSAGQLYHKLSFLADLGLRYDDSGLEAIPGKIMEHISSEGPFCLPMLIPVHFGGTGTEQYAWALCDAPVSVYSLAKMGLYNEARILKAKSHLLGLGRPNGFPCAASKELGKFRGPGKKDDPCPYATLIMLKLMSLYEEDRNSDYAKQSAESLLHLWENSQQLHPYIFYMGNDFRKLKAPFIWYDIVHVADTLSCFPFASNDRRLLEMVSLIGQKADSKGLYTAGSAWKAWKGWDFGQKNHPSAWITFLVLRIMKKMNLSDIS